MNAASFLVSKAFKDGCMHTYIPDPLVGEVYSLVSETHGDSVGLTDMSYKLIRAE